MAVKQLREVWAEAFTAHGVRAVVKLDSVEAESFEEACDLLSKRFRSEHWYDREKNTLYGCRLYPSEEAGKQDGSDRRV